MVSREGRGEEGGGERKGRGAIARMIMDQSIFINGEKDIKCLSYGNFPGTSLLYLVPIHTLSPR